MKLNLAKEPALLIAVVLLMGLLFYRLDAEPVALRGRKKGETLELMQSALPDVARAKPSGAVSTPDVARDLFVEPSDTRPLPPLDWIDPPRPELPAIFPPLEPGPTPARYGAFLRRNLTHSADGVAAASELTLPEFDDGFGSDSSRPSKSGVRAALRELGKLSGVDEEEDASETPAERSARRASYRRLYDWLELGGAITIYGSIENENRYEFFLDERNNDPILFQQIDPLTGRESFPGQAPISYEQERLTEVGLALNRSNELELHSRELQLQGSTQREVLAFAARCLESRLEAPRALDLARAALLPLAEQIKNDPAPRLALARCYEAGFDFEAAFVEYRALLEEFGEHPEVHVRFAELELRCLLYESAESRLLEAIRLDRTAWRAHWILAGLYETRCEWGPALEHYGAANRHMAEELESLAVRVAARTDLAGALLAHGDVRGAVAELETAKRLDPLHQETLAALIHCAILDPAAVGLELLEGSERALEAWLKPVWDVVEERLNDDEAYGLRFDLLMALGSWNLEHGQLSEAKTRLEEAAIADPLRAHLALRAGSYLAEAAGLENDAMEFVELALEASPGDAWSMYQRGRLLAHVGDFDTAKESFEAALEQDLDFDDALVAIGELLLYEGEYDNASRYLERALSREPDRAEVHTLAGLVRLRAGSFLEALTAFETALGLDSEDPVALGGKAWATYRTGNAAEALILFAQLDDSRRELSDEDAHRVWAREQIARITDHLEKVAWGDGFGRTVIRNGWQVDEGSGPLVQLEGESVKLVGTFARSGKTRLYREYPAGSFVSVEASLWIPAGAPVRGGLFVARERRRQRTWTTESEVSIARHFDGALEVRIERSATKEPETLKTNEIEFPTGRWARVRIERTGTQEEPTVDVFLEEIPVVVGADFPQLGRGGQPLRVGVFVEGETGREANLRIDDVVVVYRELGQ